MNAPSEQVRAALQALLDAEGDGWTLSHFVMLLGLERINSDGEVETSSWVTAPQGQPEYITDGLLNAGFDARAVVADTEDD